MKKNGLRIPSKKVQNKREIEAFVRMKAAELPPMWEDHKCNIPMKGADILASEELCEIIGEKKAESIDPQRMYYVPHTYTRRIDHYKRMINALKKGGVENMLEYYKQTVVATVESAHTITIGGIKTQVEEYATTI